MNINVEDINDFQDILISALRYALGRRTYITEETSSFIMKYPDLITKRMCSVMLRELNKYMENRTVLIHDDECDYRVWLDLQQWLIKLSKDRWYNLLENGDEIGGGYNI